jgi:predicted secreted protein
MNNYVEGKDVLMYVLKDGDYVPYLCAETVNINITPELINISTNTTGRGRHYRVRKIDWSVSVSGVTHVADDYSIFDAVDNITESLDIRIDFTSKQGDLMEFSGNVITENLGLNSGATDLSGFDHPLRGNGLYTLVQTIGGVVVTSGFDYELDFDID